MSEREEPEGFRLHWQIFWGIERLAGAFHTLLMQISPAGTSLSLPQIRILLALYSSHHPLTISRLALLLEISLPTLSRLLWQMDQQGWVRHQLDSADRRSKKVVLTSSGRRLAEEIFQRFDDVLEDIGKSIPEPVAFYEGLVELVRASRNRNLIGYTRSCHSCRSYQEREGSGYCEYYHIQLPREHVRVFCPEYQEASYHSSREV